MGQAGSGPQAFTGSLELNRGVLSFSACVCVSEGESWKGLSFVTADFLMASSFSWLAETGAWWWGRWVQVGPGEEIEGEGYNNRQKYSPTKMVMP